MENSDLEKQVKHLEDLMGVTSEKKQRFVLMKDCYVDTKTGLEWALKDHPKMLNFNWNETTDLKGGWRVPTIHELFSIVDHDMYNPATELPGIKPKPYWSASTYAPYTLSAWIVDFDDGYVYANGKPNYSYLRAVRGQMK